MFETKRIETARLILRPMTEDDRTDFLDYYLDADAAAFLGGRLSLSEKDALQIFRGNRLTPLTWAMERKSDGHVIGDVHLGDVVEMYLAHIGYLVHRDARRQGYAKEAVLAALRYTFEETSIGRVRALALPRNKASLRLLESCGFQREALLRDGDYGGRVEDVLYLSAEKWAWLDFAKRQ